MNIENSSIAELEAARNIEALLEEYAAESAVKGLPPTKARWPLYRALEAAGQLHVFAVRDQDAELAGFATLLLSHPPHYEGTVIATTESLFVAQPYRSSLAGLRLLYAVEQRARAMGAPGLLVSAPSGGALAELLPKCRYVESNRVFFKGFADA